MTKARLLDFAELLDAFRVFPRLFVGGYFIYSAKVGLWAMSLPDLTTSQATFVTAIIGLTVPMTAFYMQTGRTWTK